MYIDSHCHLDFDPLKNELETIVERAHKAGVEKLINVGSSLRGSRASIEIANKYPHILATVGLHPHDAEEVNNLEGVLDELRELSKNDKVVAIGEIGLDYFAINNQQLTISNKESQKALFKAQLEFASELNFPVIIHTRDAESDTLKQLTANRKQLTGVIHCYTGTADFAKKLLDLGFYIGFTGFVTFEQPKFDHIRESVKTVPIDRILIETDAPFLAPEPYRGKTNEPAFVVEVAKKVAEIKGLSLEEVTELTSKNAEKLFGI